MEKPNTQTLYTSTTGKLREYAAGLRITIPDGASRFDIIDIIRLFEPPVPTVGGMNFPVAPPPGEAPSETPIMPEKYSLRIQRIRDNNP